MSLAAIVGILLNLFLPDEEEEVINKNSDKKPKAKKGKKEKVMA